jgi:hypothetical protein
VDTAVGIGLEIRHSNAETDLSNHTNDLDADGSGL